jgi:hypothetical protein
VLGGRSRAAPTTAAPRPPAQETVLAAAAQREAVQGAPPATPPPPSVDGSGGDDGAPEPGKPPGKPPDWRRLGLIAAAAALILVALIPGIILLAGGDDDSESGGTTTGSTTTAPPAQATSLIEVLAPTQIGKSCTKASTPSAGAVETENCTPTEGAPTSHPNSFDLSFYADRVALDAAYEEAKGGLTEAPCGGTAGERVWVHLATGGRGGRRVCGTDDNSNFVILWTHEKLDAADHVDMLGIAREPGRSPTTFTSWWAAVNDIIGKCRPLVSEEDCTAAINELAQ